MLLCSGRLTFLLFRVQGMSALIKGRDSNNGATIEHKVFA